MSLPPPPIPAVPLGYAPPPREGRPGILTALGIVSLIVACLSCLASLGGIASAIVFLAMSGMSFPVPTPPTPRVYTGGAVTENGLTVNPAESPDAMPPPQRSIVIAALNSKRYITPQRRQHLDLLLNNSGAKIFPYVTGSTTTGQIMRDITDSGGAANQPQWFVVGAGRIEVDDDRAIFRPSGA